MPETVTRGSPLVLSDEHAVALETSPSSAVCLDRSLVRLARAEAQVDRQLGRGLAILWDRELYVRLGSARATDFVREQLGIQESRARWLARLGRILSAVPELDQAFVAGRIGASHAIELGKVLNGESPSEVCCAWIERGARLSVRELRREMSAVQAKVRGDANEVSSDANEVRGDANEVSCDPDDVPPGGWMTIPAPARVAVLWHGVLDLARAAAGRHLTHGQAAELVFAEYLSAALPETPQRPVAGQPLEDATQPLAGDEKKAMVRPATLASDLHSTNGVDTRPETDHLEALPGDCQVSGLENPWELADTLVRLNHLKKQLRYELASTLATLVRSVRPSALGYSSFEVYFNDRLGFGIRRAERLMRFHAGLEKFPLLAAAYLDGRVSYTAALLLLPILHPATEAAWVEWADGSTYRELERVAEYARIFALPGAHPRAFESWVRELQAQALPHRVGGHGSADESANDGATAFAAGEGSAGNAGVEGGATAFAPADEDAGAHAGATAFAPADDTGIPPGCALPPEPGGLPRIVGLPEDLALAEPERCVARIRFWLPQDALDLAHRALDRCRHSLPGPLLRVWSYFEFILVHFIHTHDTPEARRLERRHRIIARDGYRCTCPGCTSRMNFHSHHLEHQAQGGTDDDWNQATGCAGHHGPGFHSGVIEVGGFAPDRLVFRVGINPNTGRALACYRNERRVSEEVAVADLASWRKWWRDFRRGLGGGCYDERCRAPAAALLYAASRTQGPTQNPWRSRSSGAGFHPMT